MGVSLGLCLMELSAQTAVGCEQAEDGEMGGQTQRKRLHWSKALCTRAALADSSGVRNPPI